MYVFKTPQDHSSSNTPVDGDFFELTGEQEKTIRSVQQQIEECVPDLDERIRQQEEALEQVAQQQTM